MCSSHLEKKLFKHDYVKSVTQSFSLFVYAELQIGKYIANVDVSRPFDKQVIKHKLWKHVTWHCWLYVYIEFQIRRYTANLDISRPCDKQIYQKMTMLNFWPDIFHVHVNVELQIRRYSANPCLWRPFVNKHYQKMRFNILRYCICSRWAPDLKIHCQPRFVKAFQQKQQQHMTMVSLWLNLFRRMFTLSSRPEDTLPT